MVAEWVFSLNVRVRPSAKATQARPGWWLEIPLPDLGLMTSGRSAAFRSRGSDQ